MEITLYLEFVLFEMPKKKIPLATMNIQVVHFSAVARNIKESKMGLCNLCGENNYASLVDTRQIHLILFL